VRGDQERNFVGLLPILDDSGEVPLLRGVPVCPYTFISIILCSIMIEFRDLALNHLLTVGGSWDSFEPNGTGLTSLQSLPPFWA